MKTNFTSTIGLQFENPTENQIKGAIKEKATERIDLKLKPSTKAKAVKGAELQGRNLSNYIIYLIEKEDKEHK